MPSGSASAPGPRTRNLAAILEAERRRRGLSQEQLGARARISQSMVSELLAAKRDMRVEQLQAICEALDLDPDQVWLDARPRRQ